MMSSHAGMSDGDALRQSQEKIDHALIPAIAYEVERLLVAQVRVGRAHPEARRVISHHPPRQIDDRLQLEQALLGFAPWRRGLGFPPSHAPRIRRAHASDVSRVDDVAFIQVVEQCSTALCGARRPLQRPLT